MLMSVSARGTSSVLIASSCPMETGAFVSTLIVLSIFSMRLGQRLPKWPNLAAASGGITRTFHYVCLVAAVAEL